MSARRVVATLAVLAALALVTAHAVAAPLEPDTRYREAQAALREAVRDTAGHADEPARLVALGDALSALARFADADRAYRRALVAAPGDRAALAGAGRVALVQQREAEAESLLVLAGDAEGAARDLYLARLRRHEWSAAAAMAEAQDEPGRRAMLERLEGAWPPAEPPQGPTVVLLFATARIVPQVPVRLERGEVSMAVDPSAGELLIDTNAAKRWNVTLVPGERTVAWNGTRVAARNAIVRELRLGGFRLVNVPACVVSLHRYSMAVNPEGADLAGVLGLPVLERFGVTMDFRKRQLELRAEHALPSLASGGARVPFERWGENELVVYGSLQGSRRMAFWVGTGLPEAAFGAPQETFDEVGARPGKFANAVRAIGTALQGRPWSQVVASTLTVGPAVADRVGCWSGAMDASELWRWGARRDGLLGPGFFNGRRVTFDWDGRALVFEEAGR